MSGVFQNVDPPPLTAFGAGGGHNRWVERGGGSIFWKTPDAALYSTYVSTLCQARFGILARKKKSVANEIMI